MVKGPLTGMLVVDLSRMLPGAVLARQLLDLGARLVKVEDPAIGDPMRQVPPQVAGTGVGFAALLRGAESVAVDLRSPTGVAVVEALATRADVLVESYRPGRLASWGLDEERLCGLNPGLVWCSLPGWGSRDAVAGRVGHDLNFTAETGALGLMNPRGVPAVQLADVGTGLLAATAVLGALLARQRDGVGCRIEQPLATGPLPFISWAWAEEAVGGGGVLATLLGGGVPCYRRYRCGDGLELVVAALEPKFWDELVAALELPELAAKGLSFGAEGESVARQLAARLADMPRSHWLALAVERELPLTAVRSVAEAAREGMLAEAGLTHDAALAGDRRVRLPGPWIPSLASEIGAAVPRVGEHTEAVAAELGFGAATSPR